jgi:glyoxylase-like metal-dependent hydrolase (beta-lactamase superfamily II)
MKIFRETENLCRLTRFGMFNCFLVKGEGGCTLIDTNIGGSARAILQFSRKLGWPISRIALTHAHFDHVSSLDELASALPGVEIVIGARESRFLRGDLSLDPGEHGKELFGFASTRTKATRALADGEQVSWLRGISCPGHTPGHFAYLDVRDNSLVAGDAFVTQSGVVAAGVFKWTLPFPAWFSWNCTLSVRSAAKLRALNPSRLAVGHGKTLVSPGEAMDRAMAIGYKQYPDALKG